MTKNRKKGQKRVKTGCAKNVFTELKTDDKIWPGGHFTVCFLTKTGVFEFGGILSFK
jgi:hypothetical protein